MSVLDVTSTRLKSLHVAKPSGSPITISLLPNWRASSSATGLTAVLNGRFKGGYITRHYGQPAQNVHALQLEMTQCSYMQEGMPFDYLPEVVAQAQPTIRAMLQAVLAFAENRGL